MNQCSTGQRRRVKKKKKKKDRKMKLRKWPWIPHALMPRSKGSRVGSSFCPISSRSENLVWHLSSWNHLNHLIRVELGMMFFSTISSTFSLSLSLSLLILYALLSLSLSLSLSLLILYALLSLSLSLSLSLNIICTSLSLLILYALLSLLILYVLLSLSLNIMYNSISLSLLSKYYLSLSLIEHIIVCGMSMRHVDFISMCNLKYHRYVNEPLSI